MQGTRFHPLSGNSLHASGHLSLSTTAMEAACSRAHAQQQEKPQQREARTPQLEGSPLIITRESPSSTAKSKHMNDCCFFKWQRRVWAVCKERRALGVEEWRAAWDWPRESGAPEPRGTEGSGFVSYSFYLQSPKGTCDGCRLGTPPGAQWTGSSGAELPGEEHDERCFPARMRQFKVRF